MRRAGKFVAFGLLLGLLVALTACSSSGSKPTSATPPKGGDASGVEWILTGSTMNSVDFSKSGITARFESGRISGFGGVNQYSGPCVLGADGSVKIGPLISTQMAGPPLLMKAETTYLGLLETANSYSVSGPTLTLVTPGATLTYEAAKPVALPGSKWDVTSYNNGKQAVVSVSLGSTLTLDFNADGTVSGNSGVNTFNGPYKAGETSITIGPLASTLMAGSPELMAQETAYLQALQKATTWEAANGRLELRDASGAMQVNANAR
jgi:heat shock protein HslJ